MSTGWPRIIWPDACRPCARVIYLGGPLFQMWPPIRATAHRIELASGWAVSFRAQGLLGIAAIAESATCNERAAPRLPRSGRGSVS